jgi:phosphatidyl-myo-inositol alpha-mannosyltransferase
MKIGLVCPYDWDVPGGVRSHVADLARVLDARGHEVSVLAPGSSDAAGPAYVHLVGRAVPVPYNGAVARLAFGPRAAMRTRAWLSAGQFDVVHVHEPTVPSLSMLAVWATDRPVVATFHASNVHSRTLATAANLMRPALEKVSARIAVSEAARTSHVMHVGGEPVVIPNGVDVALFAHAEPSIRWSEPGPTVGFLGRVDEPRKGFEVALDVLARVRRRFPQARLVAAGPVRDPAVAVPPELRPSVDLLGYVDDRDKASLLRSTTVFLAPQLGGESFGIVLVEAMAAGAPVVASDLDAFGRVLDGGRVGVTFPTGDTVALAAALLQLLDDAPRRAALSAAAAAWVRRYDWATVGDELLAVYETVAAGAGRVGEDSARPWRDRLRR